MVQLLSDKRVPFPSSLLPICSALRDINRDVSLIDLNSFPGRSGGISLAGGSRLERPELEKRRAGGPRRTRQRETVSTRAVENKGG